MGNDEQTNDSTQQNVETGKKDGAPLTLTGYSMKRKEKGVPILNAVLVKTAKGTFLAKGVDSEGNKMTTIVNAAKAAALVEAGLAKMG